MDEFFSMPKEFKNLVEQILYISGLSLREAISLCEIRNKNKSAVEILMLLRDYQKEVNKTSTRKIS